MRASHRLLRPAHAIDALRRQRLLVRSDLGGVAEEGEFTLSPLGKTLAEWFGTQETRDHIGRLLEAQWFEAIESCEALLQSTSRTLQELNRTLMA